jgi:hypothetical protein
MRNGIPPSRLFPKEENTPNTGCDDRDIGKYCHGDVDIDQPHSIVHIVISWTEKKGKYQKSWDSNKQRNAHKSGSS